VSGGKLMAASASIEMKFGVLEVNQSLIILLWGKGFGKHENQELG
jgi:hypothetical protein